MAIKVLLSELTSDAQVIQRFKHRLLLASRISQKHILRIHDLSEADGVKFITMAYVEGEDLNQVLKTGHRRLTQRIVYSRVYNQRGD
jgi:eukaryotic-like serine/threonine-protein kinase